MGGEGCSSSSPRFVSLEPPSLLITAVSIFCHQTASACNMTNYFAHSENSAGIKHDLVEHLKSVARRASEFAGKFGAADLGFWAGLWHDLGKVPI